MQEKVKKEKRLKKNRNVRSTKKWLSVFFTAFGSLKLPLSANSIKQASLFISIISILISTIRQIILFCSQTVKFYIISEELSSKSCIFRLNLTLFFVIKEMGPDLIKHYQTREWLWIHRKLKRFTNYTSIPSISLCKVFIGLDPWCPTDDVFLF